MIGSPDERSSSIQVVTTPCVPNYRAAFLNRMREPPLGNLRSGFPWPSGTNAPFIDLGGFVSEDLWPY